MDCSKGTYVRTVVHDLGQRLVRAHLQSLRRTRIDQFDISQSLTLEQINEIPLGEFQNHLIPFVKRFQPMFFNDGAGL